MHGRKGTVEPRLLKETADRRDSPQVPVALLDALSNSTIPAAYALATSASTIDPSEVW
jgi:hypothetical protein